MSPILSAFRRRLSGVRIFQRLRPRPAPEALRAPEVADDETPLARGASLGEILRFIFGYWRRRPVMMASVWILMIVATIADSLLPAASGRIIDILSEGREAEGAEGAALEALLAFVALAVTFNVFRNSSVRVLIPFTSANMRDMVTEALGKVQSFSADWHANTFAGATVRRITRGMWSLDLLTDVFVLGIVPPLLVIFALTAQMAWRWPVVGGFMLAATAVFVGASLFLSLAYVAPANRQSNAADSKIGAALADAVTCNPVVKAFGAEAREEARFFAVADDWRAKAARAWRRGINMWFVQIAVLLTMQTGLIGLVMLKWREGAASAGDVVFAITSFFILAGYLRFLGDTIQQFQRGINELDEAVTFSKLAPQVADSAGAPDFAPGRGEIVFDRVRFGYEGQDRPLYDDFSLTIRAGERVALVGPSGSGKSTFVKLVQRLYDLEGGVIRIDGQDVARVGQASLRRAIALVPQDPALFHRTLAENIAYAKPEASEAEIVAAAKKARAHDFIARLPNGYGTLVGERGVKLSGGERQRVAIARAFLAQARMLVFDEATSSLDSLTEKAIQEAMAELVRGRTAILIAHRLSTVRDADRILVFEDGRIVEEGRHADLLARADGRYRALHLIQGAA